MYDDLNLADWISPNDGAIYPNSKWQDIWSSGGQQGIRNKVLYGYPRIPTTTQPSSSYFCKSSTGFVNPWASFSMKTIKQLATFRPPNAWEVAWFFLKHIDVLHHVYFVLKPNNKWELGKKDNPVGDNTKERQIILQTGTLPSGITWAFGKVNKIECKFIGTHYIVKVDGVQVIDYDDSVDGGHYTIAGVTYTGNKQTPFLGQTKGGLGFYSEDSEVEFSGPIYFSSAT